VYIDILGLYTVLFPLLCFLASWCVKYIHQHLFITTILSVLLVALMEVALYEFYFIIDETTMEFIPFLFNRLVPTILSNLLYLFMLGWVFKLLINARLIEQERNMA
jgi:rod shape-determining protein MreD